MSDLLNDPNEPVRVTIEGRPEAYFVRVPLPADRGRYDLEVRRRGARRWRSDQMMDTLEEGAREVLADQPEVLDRFLAEIEDKKAREKVFNQRLMSGALENLEDYRKARDELNKTSSFFRLWETRIGDAFPLLADRAADNGAFDAIVTPIALEMFLVGWEGYDEEFKLGRDGRAPGHLIAKIPVYHRNEIRRRIDDLMDPSEKEKNSSSSASGEQKNRAPSKLSLKGKTTPTSTND